MRVQTYDKRSRIEVLTDEGKEEGKGAQLNTSTYSEVRGQGEVLNTHATTIILM